MTLLEVKDVKKSYKSLMAVKGISFSVEKGEILGLLGPNGAGKSTTISMISTLMKPDEGSIHYCGQDIGVSPKAIRPHLGYVPQEIALYPMLSGKENLNFWGRTYGLKGKQLQKRVEAVSEIIGIKERLKDKVKTYSGGMKRRLNIGVALLHEPDLIIMDEPTVGIDPQSRKHILDTVLRLNESGKTVIYTSHYMEEVEYLCNRICIMDQGQIIAVGTKAALVDDFVESQEIHLVPEVISDEIIETIGKIDTVISVTLVEDTLVIQSEKDLEIFKKLIEVLGNFETHIQAINVHAPNLEKVFLNLTGRELRD